MNIRKIIGSVLIVAITFGVMYVVFGNKEDISPVPESEQYINRVLIITPMPTPTSAYGFFDEEEKEATPTSEEQEPTSKPTTKPTLKPSISPTQKATETPKPSDTPTPKPTQT
jgi:outer membrane biosynthesis protein TonB